MRKWRQRVLNVFQSFSGVAVFDLLFLELLNIYLSNISPMTFAKYFYMTF